MTRPLNVVPPVMKLREGHSQSTSHGLHALLLTDHIYAGTYDKGVVVWSKDVTKEKFASLPHKGAVVAIIEDGDVIYTACSDLIIGWDSQTYSQLFKLPHDKAPKCLQVDREYIYVGCDGGSVVVWNKQTRSKILTIPSKDPISTVLSLQVREKKEGIKRLFACLSSGGILVWNWMPNSETASVVPPLLQHLSTRSGSLVW